MAKVTIPQIQKMKDRSEKIAVLTAYDFTFARLLDLAGTDILLVGDSLGMVVQGNDTTLPVTLEQMIYHGRAVARGAERAHVVVDMPFGSYQVSSEKAVESAIRLVAEGGAESVKLEGGAKFADTVRAMGRASIPVMGHIGLTPQSVHKLGGHVVQGRGADQKVELLADAKALEDAGCYAIVLEAIPQDLARDITAALHIPTIGIGAGPSCDGQVLVSYDMLGLNPDFKPRFVRRFAELHENIAAATHGYVEEVKQGSFPTEANSFGDAPPVRLAAAGVAGTGYGPKV